MGSNVNSNDRVKTRGGLPRGTANGEPYFIPGLSPEIPLNGNLPRGAANGQPQVIPGVIAEAPIRVTIPRAAENHAPPLAPQQPPLPAKPSPLDDVRAVSALNELLGGGLGVGIGGVDRPPANFDENVFPENGPIAPPVFPQPARRVEPAGAPGIVPPPQNGWPNIENLSPQQWNNLQHVQDVLGQMRAEDAKKFRFRNPAEVMADPNFQRVEAMNDDERFLRNAIKDQIRAQTLPQRQAALHGMIPHQFSGFGGANDGTSAAFYRNVPRTKADPQVIKASLEGAKSQDINSLRQMINDDEERKIADDPGRKMEGLVMSGKTPEEAADIMDQIDLFSAARAQRQKRHNGIDMLNNALGAGMGNQGYQFGELYQQSGSDTRQHAQKMLEKLSQTSTLEELLGGKPLKEFGQADLAQAYDQWSKNKLNEADLVRIVEFIKAMEAAGKPVDIPRGWLWDSAETTGLREWLNALKSGSLSRPQLQGAYQGGFDRVNNPLQENREKAIRGMADSIDMGGW